MRDKEKVERTKKVRVLISKHTDHGVAHIATLEKNGMQATQLIGVFNEIPLLNSITTKEQVLEFLSDPVEFFNNAILSDISFSSKVQPPAKGIAALYEIPYDDIVGKICACKLRNLDKMVWNEKTLSIEFDQACMTEELECFYEYAQTPAENKAVVEVRKVCDILNRYCSQMNLAPADMNAAANNLGLKCGLKPEGERNRKGESDWILKENMSLIRAKLEYDRGMEGIK